MRKNKKFCFPENHFSSVHICSMSKNVHFSIKNPRLQLRNSIIQRFKKWSHVVRDCEKLTILFLKQIHARAKSQPKLIFPLFSAIYTTGKFNVTDLKFLERNHNYIEANSIHAINKSTRISICLNFLKNNTV